MDRPRMPKPYSTLGQARRRIGGQQTAQQESDLSLERRQKLALNRFTYSGGYDGYEGRMILKPELKQNGRSDGSR
jgi:hypothetical protein